MEKIKALIVDDSAFMRKVLSDILSSDSGILVIGTARDGNEALTKVRELLPDVITMDLHLPDMEGIDVIKRIMQEKPTSIVVISATAQEGSAQTLDALSAGAVDFISKPTGEISLNISNVKETIISKVKAAYNAKIKKIYKRPTIRRFSFSSTRKKIIVIGSSTGGPQTLEALITELPKNLPAPVLIVQHMPVGFTKLLADRLNNISEVRVREAKEGDELENGVVLIAPAGYHMELIAEIEGMEGTIHLNLEPAELGVRPNVNRLFRSVAKIFKENTIGVVLTGMGSDGTEGSRMIKAMNGTVIAEAEESCIIYGMPKSVVTAGLADMVLPLDNISVALMQLLEV